MTKALRDTPKNTPEEKNALYRNAFICMLGSSKREEDIINRIRKYETQFIHPIKVVTPYERELFSPTLDEIAPPTLENLGKEGVADFLTRKPAAFQKLKKDIIDIKCEESKIFENLKKAVEENKDILGQIEALNRKNNVVIIGKNHALISGIATYLWLTQPLLYRGKHPIWNKRIMSPIRKRFFNAIGKYIIGRVGFQYERCAGVSESELTKILFPDTSRIPNITKCMLFLRDVDISHSNNIKRLLGAMKDNGGYGNLVISTDTLPQDLKNQFEIIELEAEKQDTPVSTPQDTPDRQDLKFTYNKQSSTLTFNGNNDKGMKLSKKRAKLFESLKKPKNIRWILKELYSEQIERDEKVVDNKSSSFYSFASKFNKSWRNHFKLNEELELIKCEDEIVSIVQKIDWK